MAEYEYEEIRIARSDGCDFQADYWPGSVSAAAAKKTTTTPPPPPTAGSKAPMIRLAEDDARFIEWRIKLGALLKQELALHPHDGLPWYVHFPRGYWLYERAKHLFVSGYPIKSHLFASPQEFALHLLWLASTSSQYADCACVFCIEPPDDPGKSEKRTKSKVAVAAVAAAAATDADGSSSSSSDDSDALVITSPPPVMFRVGELVWYYQGLWRLAFILSATPAPQPPQTQQLYQNTPKQDLPQRYTILLIGHSQYPRPATAGVPETLLRPFLAFSIPKIQIAPMAQIRQAFDFIPWTTYFANIHRIETTWKEGTPEQRQRLMVQKREELLVDASKYAAHKVNVSYSLFDPLDSAADPRLRWYGGVFLGAERVHAGDTLRIRLPASSPLLAGAKRPVTLVEDVFFALQAVGVSRTGARAPPRNGESSAPLPGRTGSTSTETPSGNLLMFRGRICQLVQSVANPTGPSDSSSSSSSSSPGSPLPIIPLSSLSQSLRDEIQWRTSLQPSRPWHCHQLPLPASSSSSSPSTEFVQLHEFHIRGRFYPTLAIQRIQAKPIPAETTAHGVDPALLPTLNNRMEIRILDPALETCRVDLERFILALPNPPALPPKATAPNGASSTASSSSSSSSSSTSDATHPKAATAPPFDDQASSPPPTDVASIGLEWSRETGNLHFPGTQDLLAPAVAGGRFRPSRVDVLGHMVATPVRFLYESPLRES